MADNKNTTAKKETVAKTNTAAALASVAAKKAEPAAPAAKAADTTTVKKAEAPKAAEKKAPVKKAEAPKKTAAKKAELKKRGRKPAVAKKAEPRVQEVYFEFGEKQVEAGDIVSKVEQAYKDAGHQIGRIKDLKVYINSEEGRAYYVINGAGEGKFIEL